MNVSDFNFDLPDELIAQHPRPRGSSRLLVLDRPSGARRDTTMADLPSILVPGDVLVVNNTRVMPARLLGHRVTSGGAVECLLLGPTRTVSTRSGDGEFATSSTVGHPIDVNRSSDVRMADALMHPGQKLKPGARVRFEGSAGVLLCEVMIATFPWPSHDPAMGRRWRRRRCAGRCARPRAAAALYQASGHRRGPGSLSDGVCARPRFGRRADRGPAFHVRPAGRARRRGVERAEITLHVGYGTFKPVRVTRVEDHVVDPEHYEIATDRRRAIARAKREGRRVIAVGTTTTRALEDAAARGRRRRCAGPGTASLFIYPGHRFRVDRRAAHQLPPARIVSADARVRVRRPGARPRGVSRGGGVRYRFYSYGDAMLIL